MVVVLVLLLLVVAGGSGDGAAGADAAPSSSDGGCEGVQRQRHRNDRTAPSIAACSAAVNSLLQLKALATTESSSLSTWQAVTDPCGSWQGIACTQGRVTTM
jgi:hypothetical protein